MFRVPVYEATKVPKRLTGMLVDCPAARVTALANPVTTKGGVTYGNLTVTLAPPVLIMVTVWGALVVPRGWPANVNEVGETLIDARAPVPLRGTTTGVFDPEMVSVNWPLKVCSASGENFTLYWVDAPAFRVIGPPEKSVNSVGVAVTALMVTVVVPVLVTVKVFAALVEFTA
jgi:hypothetical protein